MKKTKIALLAGGFSAEREVSLKTGQKIADNLDKNKYIIKKYDPKFDLVNLSSDLKNKKVDVVFPALHGPFGEDGTIQGMLELFRVPYVFSGVLASAIAMDKVMTKKILQTGKILMPGHVILDKDYRVGELRKIKLPVVVKPVDQGSSVGTFVITEKKELARAIKEAFKYANRVMIEDFIEGREITAAVLGNERPRALPLVEIKPKVSTFFDYRAKYEIGGSEDTCPAPINSSITKKIQDVAIKIHQMLGCRGVTRSDFILRNGQFYFLEINTIPGMTITSLVPQAAAQAGLAFPKLLDKLIELALE